MTVEKAIKKAVEAGFEDAVYLGNEKDGSFADISDTLLNPSFWQFLGKALGWDKFGKDTIKSVRGLPKYIQPKTKSICSSKGQDNVLLWLYHWHDFIDYLAEGKTAKGFFKKLTPNNVSKE